MLASKIIGIIERRRAEKKQRYFEELRRISDDFGWGSILRYGEDRYGNPSATQVAEAGRFDKFAPEKPAVLPEDCAGTLEIKTSYERAHGI